MHQIRITTFGLLILFVFTVSSLKVSFSYDQTVYQAQKRLNELGYNPGPLDGFWGKKTENAIKSFQRDQRLPISGKLDEETINKLELKQGLALFELHAVAGQGNIERVKSLLKQGSEINEKDGHGLTPLHYAAAFAELEIVKYLVEKGADINAQDHRGKTPLHYSSAADMTIPFGGKQLGSVGFGMLMLDAQFTDVVEFLLSKGAKCNITDKEGLTPLHEIAFSGTQGINSEKRARALLAAGADSALKDNKGRTPYELAFEKKNQSIAGILVPTQKEQRAAKSEPSGTTNKPLRAKKTDITSATNIISDYLTLIVWMINRDRISPEAWKTWQALLDKHCFEGAKHKASVMVPESFQMVLFSSGFAFKFGATWVDPLPVFMDRRGVFPPIVVRNGSVSPVGDGVRLRIDIGDGTEVMVDGVSYIYRNGQWKEQ